MRRDVATATRESRLSELYEKAEEKLFMDTSKVEVSILSNASQVSRDTADLWFQCKSATNGVSLKKEALPHIHNLRIWKDGTFAVSVEKSFLEE